jgi:Ca-activated chloride channel family protein
MWFLTLIPGIILLSVLWKKKGDTANLQQLCDPELLPHLLLNGHVLRKSKNLPLILLCSSLLVTVISLAGPVWKRQAQSVFRVQEARVLVLDLSPSMAARDIRPDRLARALFKLKDFLDRSREGRTGLVVFSGESHIVVPLTDDIETIKSMLPALRVDIMPVSGDFLEPGLEQAAALFRRGNAAGGEIVVVTDGVADVASSMNRIATLSDQGITVSVLALGTETGAPIPAPDGGFKTGSNGETRISRMERQPLEELARAGNGRFTVLSPDDQDLDMLLTGSQRHNLDKAEGNDEHSVELWQEEGIYLVPLILFLAALGFRRGWLVCFLLLLVFQSVPVMAFEWDDLWQRADQRAAKKYSAGELSEAAEMFLDPKWKGTAQYEAGDYQAAVETFSSLPDEYYKFYNLGNALAKSGRYQESLKAYEKALEQNPDDPRDAKKNRDLIKKLLSEQQEQQKGEKQSEGNKDQGKQGTDSKQPKDGMQQTGSDDSSSEQKEKESESQENPGQESSKQTETGDQKNTNSTKDKDQVAGQGGKQGDQHDQSDGEDIVTAQQKQKESEEGAEDPAREVRTATSGESEQISEKEMALEQWLRQVPDDPSGLLERKFMIEHLRRQGKK